jgi:hypothetical protein
MCMTRTGRPRDLGYAIVSNRRLQARCMATVVATAVATVVATQAVDHIRVD